MLMHQSKEAFLILGNMVTALHLLEECAEFSSLIPEVRTNLAYALSNARSPQDVAAIPGRITVVRGFPRAAGLPGWGASDHLARRIIESRKYAKTINAMINFKFDTRLIPLVQDYCRENNLLFGWLDRSQEPEELQQRDEASMPWKVEQLFIKYKSIPLIYYEGPGWGKEPLFLINGGTAVEVVRTAIEIAERWNLILRSSRS
jgi:hydroxymethylpyrimidine/phosphomethylpyrimidine kinase